MKVKQKDQYHFSVSLFVQPAKNLEHINKLLFKAKPI